MYLPWSYWWLTSTACIILLNSSSVVGQLHNVDIGERVSDIIPMIQANETLYSDIELSYEYSYRLASKKGVDSLFETIRVHAEQITQRELYWLQ